MDKDTAILGVAGAGILASKDLMVRLLGPSCDYLGGRAKELVEKADTNLGRIFQKAWEKLGEEREKDGAVNPRVLKHVWDEGRFIEDELAAEYFGGLLASSRNEDGTDDAALPFVKLVSQMSSAQIRMHYIAYGSLPGAIARNTKPCPQQHSTVLILPMNEARESFIGAGMPHGPNGLSETLDGLIWLRLIGRDSHIFGVIDTDDKALIQPEYIGAELFLRAQGKGGLSPAAFIDGREPWDGTNLSVPPCSGAYINFLPDSPTHEDVRNDIKDAITRFAREHVAMVGP